MDLVLTYTWEFGRFLAHPALNDLTNVVYNVEYILSATDQDGHGSQYFGNVGLGEPDPLTFIPFNQLTQPAVEQMVTSALGDDAVAELKQILANQIAQQIQPTIANLSRPW
jgi:hypothetical protein